MWQLTWSLKLQQPALEHFLRGHRQHRKSNNNSSEVCCVWVEEDLEHGGLQRDGRWIERSSFHDRINSLTDSLPVPWHDANSCFGNAYDPVSHGHSWVSYRDLKAYETLSLLATRLREHWDTTVYVCVWCSASPSSSPSSCMFVPSCCSSAICPSWESGAECFVTWLPANTMFPSLSLSLSVATLCLNEPKWNYMETSTELYRSNSHPGTKESLSFIIMQTFLL